MAENLFDAGGFIVSFPLWTIGVFDPEIRAIAQSRHPDGEIAVVLFSDDDQARVFFRQRAAPEGFALKSISDPSALLVFLGAIEQLGNTHVTFDPSSGTKATSFSIAALRNYAARWIW